MFFSHNKTISIDLSAAKSAEQISGSSLRPAGIDIGLLCCGSSRRCRSVPVGIARGRGLPDAARQSNQREMLHIAAGFFQ